MDPIDNSLKVSQELMMLAQQQGVDLEPFCIEGHFLKDQRFIFLWRKDERPWSGPANEPEGTLHYTMQGAVASLPDKLRGSAQAFQGAWSEAGTFESIEQALDLLKAWLLEKKEIDELPQRQVRSYGIG